VLGRSTQSSVDARNCYPLGFVVPSGLQATGSSRGNTAADSASALVSADVTRSMGLAAPVGGSRRAATGTGGAECQLQATTASGGGLALTLIH
jgi:hypothetical protein